MGYRAQGGTVRKLIRTGNSRAILIVVKPAAALSPIIPLLNGVNFLRRMIFGLIGPKGLRGIIVMRCKDKSTILLICAIQ